MAKEKSQRHKKKPNECKDASDYHKQTYRLMFSIKSWTQYNNLNCSAQDDWFIRVSMLIRRHRLTN